MQELLLEYTGDNDEQLFKKDFTTTTRVVCLSLSYPREDVLSSKWHVTAHTAIHLLFLDMKQVTAGVFV